MAERRRGRGPRRPRRERPARRELGRVLHYVKTGHLIVEAAWRGRPPELGLRVVDGEGRPVGTLVDVIGPVERPYAVVRPSGDGVPEPGTLLYIIEPQRPRGRRARRPPGGRRPRTQRGRGGGAGGRRGAGPGEGRRRR